MPLDVAQLGESPSGKAPGVPYSPLYDDVYHARAGAAAQAQHVFLQGNGLPERWQGRDQFVILETGFGLGNNFLQTWDAWRADPRRCKHLFFVSIEKHPLLKDDLQRVHEPLSAQAAQLVARWPVLTPGLHTLDFDDEHGQVTLLLGLGDVADLLPDLVMQVDAFYLDGFAPAKNPQMWDEGVLSRLGRLAAPGSTAATWSVARSVRDGLTQAGFAVTRAPGFAWKPEMLHAVFEPRHVPVQPHGGHRPGPALAQRHAVVIGAGLAGCVATWALCREGWQVTLLEQHSQPAQEASGNPGGLFHSIVHGEDGIHARAHRAAALALSDLVAPWIQTGRVAGQVQGLLRLDGKTTDEQATQLLSKLGLPPDYVHWLNHEEACKLAAVNVPSGGWLFKQAGWLHPAGLAKTLLDEAQAWADRHGQSLTRLMGAKASRLSRQDGVWQVWGDESAQAPNPALASAPYLVLTNANQVNQLLQTLPAQQAVAAQPLTAIRGQVTTLRASDSAKCVHLPSIPVAGSGYALSLPDGRLLCGATTQHHDDSADVRPEDHAHNLGQAKRLGVLNASDTSEQDLAQSPETWGRVGWRASTPDRLPLVGALPLSAERLAQYGQGQQGQQGGPSNARVRLDQPRMIPRERNDDSGGLFILSGLGSRGITWSILTGRLLAHWITGTPCPVEADLRDALDPARFVARNHSKKSA